MFHNIRRFIVSRYLAEMNIKHLSKYPQLVGYCFDAITGSIHLDGRYERDELDFLEKHVFPRLNLNGSCIDIGANIGNHSLSFAAFFNQVISLEPHPTTFRLLEINAELVSNVKAYNIGASNEHGKLEVAINKLNQGATSIGASIRTDTDTVMFDLIRLDDFEELKSVNPVSFIKLDVEGHEVDAILGAKNLLLNDSPVIAIEILRSEIDNGTCESVELLKKFGYKNFYEMREKGWLGRLSRRPKKLARTIITLITGLRPSTAAEVGRVLKFEKRTYPMLICTTDLELTL